MLATHTVGILGGMGPAAGADFARLFVEACAGQLRARGLPVRDQAFPEHWIAQVPVPDRSGALESTVLGGHQPLEPMLQALGRLAALGSRAVAIACNTAHAWHGTLQARFPQIEVLHVAREVAAHLAARGVRDAALMATEGTYRVGLYEQAMAAAGIACHLPRADERLLLMRGIYEGVKAGDMALARACFGQVARQLAERHGPAALVMGCTEIPLGLQGDAATKGLPLLDPARVLAGALAARAYSEVQLPMAA
ncbi:amino acid racemase [Variovorax sp. J22P168]|uniref:aspartate/glutamate racemase family protein n=1 Tax=Variovorax jilinensis TaxID=3053513 RepID=UPI002575B213|nr:amino acid racemase [Variovorax sp. J22P168]MDM0012752.1 amino acid racemase [Variovorax sp. J22P168]